MKKTCFALLAASVFTGVFSGCYSTPQGTLKPSIIPFAKDTIENRYQVPVPQVLNAAREVLNHNGTVTSDDVKKNVIEAKINTRTVWVAVDDVEPKITRVRVQVRTKGGSPDIDMSSEIATQIALRLR